MNDLEQYYQELLITPSDINEHLPVLKKYAEQCESVTEMGVRFVVSTAAFIKGNPQNMVSIDIEHPSFWNKGENLDKVVNYATENKINYKFIKGDTRTIDIEETDLLFIDTLHTYEQLKIELERHGNKVKKFLMFHDTTLFEFNDEVGSSVNQNTKGLWPAIEEFLLKNKNWSVLERYTNNNGLTILKNNNSE